MPPIRNLVPLALLPLIASAQTTIFSTDFSTGGLRLTSGNTVDVGDWVVASTKATNAATGSGAISGSSYATGAFGFGMAGTTSGVVQAQSRFTGTPVTLDSLNSYIEVAVLFTDTTNLLKSNGGTNALSSTLNIGLFDSGGVSPAAGLGSSGLTATTGNATFGTGFAQNWTGYAARIGTTESTSNSINQVLTRPAQTANTASANQDLLFMGVGGGTYGQNATVGVPGVSAGSSASTLAAGTLVNATQYRLTYRITNSGENAYSINYTLSDSTGLTALQTFTGNATGSSFITGLDFDGLAVGYRSAQSTSAPGGGTSVATGMTLNSVSVVSFSPSAIPEPSAFAALAGLAALGLAALRRPSKA